jgi:hypothetical protein
LRVRFGSGSFTFASAILRRCSGSRSPASISSRVSWLVPMGSSPLMPAATSPSAMPFTSSGWSLQKSAICSNDKDVFSTSQTAVALGISGAWDIL